MKAILILPKVARLNSDPIKRSRLYLSVLNRDTLFIILVRMYSSSCRTVFCIYRHHLCQHYSYLPILTDITSRYKHYTNSPYTLQMAFFNIYLFSTLLFINLDVVCAQTLQVGYVLLLTFSVLFCVAISLCVSAIVVSYLCDVTRKRRIRNITTPESNISNETTPTTT